MSNKFTHDINNFINQKLEVTITEEIRTYMDDTRNRFNLEFYTTQTRPNIDNYTNQILDYIKYYFNSVRDTLNKDESNWKMHSTLSEILSSIDDYDLRCLSQEKLISITNNLQVQIIKEITALQYYFTSVKEDELLPMMQEYRKHSDIAKKKERAIQRLYQEYRIKNYEERAKGYYQYKPEESENKMGGKNK